MRHAIEWIAAAGLAGTLFACGGVEPPEAEEPAAPEEPAATEKLAATEKTTPEDEAAPEDETAPEEEAAPEDETAPEEAGDEDEGAEGDEADGEEFVGKGVEKSAIGSNKGAKGVTHFDHWKHQRIGVKCVRCHHKGSGRRSCGAGKDCHRAREINAPTARAAYHKSCNGCHRKKGLPKGCDYCHQPKEG
ncbi:MAG: cytochrome c3 family protein [Polyangia bacterium]